MLFEYAEKHDDTETIVHRADARIKLASALISIVFISFSKSFYPIAIIMPIVLVLIFIAKVSLLYILNRIGICFPFLIFMLLLPPMQAIMLLSKSLSTITIIALLMSTTRFSEIISAMTFFRVPRMFTMMLSFLYRYLFLFRENIHKMKCAANSRCFGHKKQWNKWNISIISNMTGCLFIRSFEQSERVYNAMLARGYDDKN